MGFGDQVTRSVLPPKITFLGLGIGLLKRLEERQKENDAPPLPQHVSGANH